MHDSIDRNLKPLLALLGDALGGSPISDLRPIVGGDRSSAYSFTADGEGLILRINSDNTGFLKDKYAYDHFSALLPIPKAVKTGHYTNKYYSITKKCQGITLQASTPLSEICIQDLAKTLDAIRETVIPADSMYGTWDPHGIATCGTWQEWLQKDYILVEKNDGNYFKWDEITGLPTIDREIIAQLKRKIDTLITFVPNERSLVHGDFGTGNVVIDGDHVSGVIDWAESMYGDHLYDAAWLDFWQSNSSLTRFLHDHYRKLGIKDYEQRVLCYQCVIALNTLGIYAAIDYRAGYASTLMHTRHLLAK